MIMPQFSLRTLLAATAVAGGLSLVGAFAYQGAGWALGVVAAVAGLALTFFLFIMSWGVAIGVGGVRHLMTRRERPAESPFAQHKAAPQVLEPREYEP